MTNASFAATTAIASLLFRAEGYFAAFSDIMKGRP
jgi:hypothetical protein